MDSDGKSGTLTITRPEGESEVLALAKTALRPTVNAAITIRTFARSKFGDVELTALVRELGDQASAASGGDLARPEAMLVAQAHSLDAIFRALAERAHLNMGEYPQAAETYMRLALKAQGQCRATVETLGKLKNPPPVAFVRQANIGQAVQVNNGVPSPSRAGEPERAQSRLLGADDGKRLDIGAAIPAGDVDSDLETVGAVHGPAHGEGEGDRQPECLQRRRP